MFVCSDNALKICVNIFQIACIPDMTLTVPYQSFIVYVVIGQQPLFFYTCSFLTLSSSESFLGSHFCLLIYCPMFIKMALLDPSVSPSISGVAEISMVDSHSRIPLLIPPESCSLSTVWSWCWEGLSSMDYISQPRFRQGTQWLSSGQCHEGRHDKYRLQG